MPWQRLTSNMRVNYMELKKIGLGTAIAFAVLILVVTGHIALAVLLVIAYCAWFWRKPLLAIMAFIHHRRKV